MYVGPGTTQKQIKAEIARIEDELAYCRLTTEDRQALHEELDYLYSFLPRENG